MPEASNILRLLSNFPLHLLIRLQCHVRRGELMYSLPILIGVFSIKPEQFRFLRRWLSFSQS